MKLAQYNECLVSIVDTDGLVLWHQGISSNSAEYAPMHFPVFRWVCQLEMNEVNNDFNIPSSLWATLKYQCFTPT